MPITPGMDTQLASILEKLSEMGANIQINQTELKGEIRRLKTSFEDDLDVRRTEVAATQSEVGETKEVFKERVNEIKDDICSEMTAAMKTFSSKMECGTDVGEEVVEATGADAVACESDALANNVAEGADIKVDVQAHGSVVVDVDRVQSSVAHQEFAKEIKAGRDEDEAGQHEDKARRADVDGVRVEIEAGQAKDAAGRDADKARRADENEAGRAEHEAGRAEDEDGRVDVEARRAEIETGQAEVESRRARDETGRAEAEARRVDVDARQAEDVDGRANADARKADVDTERADVDAGRAVVAAGLQSEDLPVKCPRMLGLRTQFEIGGPRSGRPPET